MTQFSEPQNITPDGASVRRTESVPAAVEFPEGFDPRAPDGYFDPGDWRVIFAPNSLEGK